LTAVTGRYGNLQKHLNPNPIQRWLLGRFYRRILDLVTMSGARQILDAGCGEGFTMCELKRGGVRATMLGVDLSRTALAWSRDRQVAQSPLAVADVHRLPFSSNDFDLVLCLEVLEHLPDSAAGLRELLRVSGEYILVSVPHEPFFRWSNFLRGKHFHVWGNDPEHLHGYTGRAFKRLVSSQASMVWFGYSFPWQIALLRKIS
jgi:SAM-dependent methyltransferase